MRVTNPRYQKGDEKNFETTQEFAIFSSFASFVSPFLVKRVPQGFVKKRFELSLKKNESKVYNERRYCMNHLIIFMVFIDRLFFLKSFQDYSMFV